MRNLLFLTTLMIWSCSGQSQNLNKEIVDVGSKPYLLGKINKQGLTGQNYSSWFTTGYEEYQPNLEVINDISSKLKKYKILLFMGTWCGDSRREVPRFYKVLETAGYPMKQLTSVAVSSKPHLYKQSPDHEEKGMNIHRVPTFIFFKNGKEVNRIVEHPVVSFEDDILNIILRDYTSNYHLVTKINEGINEADFYDKSLKNIASYKGMAKSMYELNTYSRILETTNRKTKALEVLKLNVELFPEQPGVYVALANFQVKLDKQNDAIINYEKAYAINPKNQKIKNRIDQLKSELKGSNN